MTDYPNFPAASERAHLDTVDPFGKGRAIFYSPLQKIADDGRAIQVEQFLPYFRESRQNKWDSTMVDHRRGEFIDGLRLWVDSVAGETQSDSWRFLDFIWSGKDQFVRLNSVDEFEFKDWADKFAAIESKAYRRREPEPIDFVWNTGAKSKKMPLGTDQQDWMVARDKGRRYLSRREFRAILDAAFQTIETFEDAESFDAILDLFRNVIIQEVSSRFRFRVREISSWRPNEASVTRERILNFALHTGNSPPSLGVLCPGAGWVPVSFITVAQEMSHETVRGRKYRGDLLDAIRTKRARSYFSRGAQDRATACGRVQPAGRRCARAYSALGQRAGALGFEYPRQVASNVCVVRGQRGCFRDSIRTSLEEHQ